MMATTIMISTSVNPDFFVLFNMCSSLLAAWAAFVYSVLGSAPFVGCPTALLSCLLAIPATIQGLSGISTGIVPGIMRIPPFLPVLSIADFHQKSAASERNPRLMKEIPRGIPRGFQPTFRSWPVTEP
jgi:hypothetical protein